MGRGVRIEPEKNKRKRLLSLYNASEVEAELFEKLKDKVAALETLTIFGTNKDALRTVIEHLNTESRKRDFQQLSLFKNPSADEHELLIPVYRWAEKPMIESGDSARFEIEPSEQELLTKYVKYVGDDRVLMALYDAEPQKVGLLKDSVNNPHRFYKASDRAYRNIDLLVRRIFDYFDVVPQEFERLKQVEDEINHFKNIRVALADISDLAGKVESVRQYPERAKALSEEMAKMSPAAQQAVRDMLAKEASATYQLKDKKINIKNVANHYYIPMILSDETERIQYIKHIIQTKSEIDFVDDLEKYLSKAGNKFAGFDWWMFSKLDGSLDDVYIPYYDGTSNKILKFKPDFIFWLQKGDHYYIVFIDPKGTEHTDYQRKIEGYRTLFEDADGGQRLIPHNGKDVKVFAFLRTDDRDKVRGLYKKYWFDNIEKALGDVLTIA